MPAPRVKKGLNPDKTYRQRLHERTRAGQCAYSLSCSGIPERHTLCPAHHELRLQQQEARRGATKTPGSSRESLNVVRRIPSISQAASPTRSFRAPNISWDKLIWVSFPDAKPLDETATLAIQLFPEDRQSLGHDPWIAEACSMKLRNTVIPAEDGGYYIHQGLVTLLATKALGTLSVVAHTWDWLAQQLQGNLLFSSCIDENGRSLRSILFLHWTTNEPKRPSLDTVYSAVRLLKHTHQTSFRAYPNESEADQDMYKLGDIRALDEVAQLSPPEFSYRPETCYGHGPCKLQDCQITVHKRTHSGCAAHVHVRKRGENHGLTCDPERHTSKTPSRRGGSRKNSSLETGKSSKNPAHDVDQSAHWFHQEFVPSLQSCEFRVFIATEPSAKSNRGRIGRVVAIAKTAFDKDTQALAAREFLTEDLEPTLTRSDLVRFALFVFESLRARADSMVFFESLEVGVRLDIGVADNGVLGKSFFVNEITRWYGAHYFSHNICAEPKTQICKAFARAFRAFVNGNTGCVF